MIRTTLSSRRRRGTVLIIVMVLLLVIVSIAGSLLRTVVLDARQAKIERHALQADRLAEAGLHRAAASLKSDADYQGEAWVAPLPGGTSATVEIRVTNDGGSLVEVVANLPADTVHSVRARRRARL